nr:PREDICTED: cardiotrophin-2-like [Lepisosteus oculatus]
MGSDTPLISPAAMLSLYLLLCVCVSVLPPVAAKEPFSYTQSLILTRKIHRDICSLLAQYKEDQMGSKDFEDHSLVLTSLPSSTMNYSSWLNMEDTARLQTDARDLHVFGIHVDAKRLYELQGRVPSPLSRALYMVVLDIRDLVHQIRQQLQSLQAPAPVLGEPSLPESLLNPQFPWHSRLQGYIILRDLERYLDKVVRDFTLLKSRQQQ